MEDIEMSNDSNNNKLLSNEESSLILNNIKNELQLINNYFSNSINDINKYTPLSERNCENNNRDIKSNNYEQEKDNFNNKINTYNNQMNENFGKIFELVNNLKNFDEFNVDEGFLKKKLEEIKEKNKNSNDKLEKEKKAVDIIYSKLKFDNNMANDINQRNEQNEQIFDYYNHIDPKFAYGESIEDKNVGNVF